MPSKKTKQAQKGAIESLPVNPLTLTFVSEVKPELLKSNTEIDGVAASSLPKEVKHTLVVEKLKGFQYSEDFLSILENFDNKEFYKAKEVLVSSRSGNVVRTTLSALTNSVSLLNFMLNNAVKLYMHAHENKMDIGRVDRNYAEICGMLQHTDQSKAYVSKSMTKSIKTDIKEISTMNAMQHEETYASNSPLRTTSNQLLLVLTPAKVEAYKAKLAEQREENKKKKLIGYKK